MPRASWSTTAAATMPRPSRRRSGQLEVESQPAEVCLRTGDEDLGCYGSREAATAAQAGITVQPQAPASPSSSASPSGSPSASAGPAPPAERYCLTDPAGEELACFGSRTEADDALAAVELRVTERTWCVVDTSTRPEPTPTPTPEPSRGDEPGPNASAGASVSASASESPSPSPSPTPAGIASLDLEGAAEVPCALGTKEDADDALAAIEVRDISTEFCVVSSAGEGLGCFLSEAAAEQRQRDTGQERLLQVIGETARLEERAVLDVIAPQDPRWVSTPITCETAEEREQPDCSFDALAGEEVVYLRQDGAKLRLGPVVLTGENVERASAVLQGGGSTGVVTEWAVDFVLDGTGSDAFAEATTAAVGAPPPTNQIAIVVDRIAISDPVVQQPITNGTGVITGGFTEQDAKDLATQLNAGALPVELTRQSVRSVSPTLGEESLDQGILAGAVGLILLFLYLLFYYRLLGVVAWAGMSIWAVLAIALVALAGDSFGYALTLAGVAGLVISLGVTADSYIVFFERLKDEVRNGRSPRSAVQPAFARSFRTIVAADIVTGIAAAVLYFTAVSSVRGFALTLGVSVILDLFVVYFFKRPTVFLIARNRRLVEMRGFGLTSGVAGEADEPGPIGADA